MKREGGVCGLVLVGGVGGCLNAWHGMAWQLALWLQISTTWSTEARVGRALFVLIFLSPFLSPIGNGRRTATSESINNHADVIAACPPHGPRWGFYMWSHMSGGSSPVKFDTDMSSSHPMLTPIPVQKAFTLEKTVAIILEAMMENHCNHLFLEL